MTLQTPQLTTVAKGAAGPEQPSLAAGEVHVWIGDTAEQDELPLERLLSQSERDRARRFHHAQDRRCYAIRHGLLRLLLGRYLGCDGAAIDIVTSASGKPSLPPDGGHAWLHFNLSSSRGICLFAFARSRDVGIDIEAVDTRIDVQPLVARLLTPAETLWWRSLAPGQRTAAFHDLWTRKEACVKCTGEGVGVDLTRIESELPEPSRHGGAPRTLPPCGVTALHTPPGYAAALAFQGPAPRVISWHI